MPANNILIVEDEVNIRSMIAQQLRRDGHEVMEAASGLEGLISAEENSPEVIILDMLMPGMHGLEFLSRMEQRNGDPASIIVMSGSLDRDLTQKCMAAGVTEILYKPFLLTDLKSAVKRAAHNKPRAA